MGDPPHPPGQQPGVVSHCPGSRSGGEDPPAPSPSAVGAPAAAALGTALRLRQRGCSGGAAGPGTPGGVPAAGRAGGAFPRRGRLRSSPVGGGGSGATAILGGGGGGAGPYGMSSRAAVLALGALLCAAPPGLPGAAAAVWPAWLNVSWEDSADHNRSGWEASESGLYGQDSPLKGVSGVLVLPDGRDSFNACSAGTNFSGAPPPGGGSPGWLAFIQRGGGCSFADKIRLAEQRGAAAAVIYNYRGTGNEVLPMSHHGEPPLAGSGGAVERAGSLGWELPREDPRQDARAGLVLGLAPGGLVQPLLSAPSCGAWQETGISF